MIILERPLNHDWTINARGLKWANLTNQAAAAGAFVEFKNDRPVLASTREEAIRNYRNVICII